LNGESRRTLLFSDPLAGKTVEMTVSGEYGHYLFGFSDHAVAADCAWSAEQARLTYEGKQLTTSVIRHGDHFTILLADTQCDLIAVTPFMFETAEEVPGGRLTALMPGRIVKVFVAPGDEVKRGQPLLIMEAMKMEHTVHSPRDGVIEQVVYKANQIVDADAVLFAFAE
jgi:3-methylcrotonyl-CoA carboxylase alpha subunit